MLVVALLCLGVALRPAHSAHAAPAGTVTMSPSDVYLQVGESIAITLIVSGGQDIHEVHLALAYNSAVVQVIDANAGQPGVQILPGPFPASDDPGVVLQNTAGGGSITYQYSLPGNETDSGTGTVATVQFLALADGNANFTWQTAQLTDEDGVPVSAGGNVASLVVGGVPPTPGVTDTPTTAPAPTETPTGVPTETPTAIATGTTAATSTATAATTATVATTSTAAATLTPVATKPAATPTVKITVIEDTNQGPPPQSGVDPSQSERADGLPSAGSATGSIAWWRWVFFMAALMFGVAGWFFTLAVYNNSKEVVLVDRHDKRRRRK